MFDKLPPLGAVIRESAQNSLDARTGKAPVRMRISVHSGENSMPRSVADTYLGGLFKHLEASGVPKIPDSARPMPYLVIEDFGTKGLIGDPRLFFESDSKKAEEERFYWFHRNNNRTQSQTKRGGSFGYGKASFALASDINSFLTVTRGVDGSIKVFGSAIAKNHSVDGVRYQPYGDYGFAEVEEDGDTGIVPSEDLGFFDRVIEDFGLHRGDEPGLSVIIPFPQKEYSSNQILESFIRNYFVPICLGDLVLEVSENGHSVTVSDETIRDITDRLHWSDEPPGAMTKTNRACMTGMVELAKRWADGLEAVQLAPLGEGQPFWYPDLIPEESYDDLRSRLESGEPLELKIEIPVFGMENGRKDRYPDSSEITILLKKDDAFGKSDAVWIRRYLSVPKADHTPKKPGYIGIVMALEGPIEELLRNSEEVAHTEHRPHSARISDRYKYARDLVGFYRKSAAHLVEYLTKPSVLLESSWMDDYFPPEAGPAESDKPKKRRKRRKKKPEEDDDDIIVGPQPPPEDFSKDYSWGIEKCPGGFSVSGDVRHDLDVVFKVAVGYARDGGADSFKKWMPFDFELDASPISIDSEDVVLEYVGGNTLAFRVEGQTDGFSATVTGFDKDRDLEINARPTAQRRGE
jgi:hypothetical protein